MATQNRLVNLKEELVTQTLEKIYETRDDICKCEICRLDVLAYALNTLPPKYIVTDTGYVYARVEEFRVQREVDVIVAINRAIEIVKKNPRHE